MIALSHHCLTATVGTVSFVPLSGCPGLCSSIDFGHAISASLDLAGFEDACRLPLLRAVESVVRDRPRQPATSAGVKYLSK